MVRMLIWLGMHATEIVVVLGISTPCVWWVIAAMTEDWRRMRRDRREAARWERLEHFFATHGGQYPEAADAFGKSRCWHSFSQGKGAGW